MARHTSTTDYQQRQMEMASQAEIDRAIADLHRRLMARPACPGCGSRLDHVASCVTLAEVRVRRDMDQASGADWEGMVADSASNETAGPARE